MGSSVHSYSEIYESATRESIDETITNDRINDENNTKNKPVRKSSSKIRSGSKLKPKVQPKFSKSASSVRSTTWTHKYTTQQIDKSRNKIGWDELVNLEQLYSLKMIDITEYRERKRKLIDSMTGTKVKNKEDKTQRNDITKYIEECKNPPQKRVLGETEIIKQIVNFNKIRPERAIRHSCHIKIKENDNGEWETKEEWSQDMRSIKMANNPFNNGTLRLVYYMKDVTNNAAEILMVNKKENDDMIKNTATHVAKISIDPMEEFETYFHDVAMQNHAQRFADKFNINEVPKKVGFLDCWVYELVDRIPHIFCGVEQFIEGEYHKYTNNWDWVNQQVDRNTPSAFSHFTYHASKKKILICDLQGVADLYTDPQMHTYNGKGCGKGNMGKRGIDKFLSSHKCNAICTYLKLPPTNLASQLQGTLPQKRYMNNDKIDQIPVTANGQYTIPETVARTQNSTYQNTYNNNMNSQLLSNTTNTNKKSDEYEDDGYDNPFGAFKRIDDDKESDTCDWCTIL
eukprot:246776_1